MRRVPLDGDRLCREARSFKSASTSWFEQLLEQWPEVRATILARATQTNEANRCAVLLPFVAELPQPLRQHHIPLGAMSTKRA